MSELPQGWAKTTLGEICSKPQYGWTSKAGQTGKLRYLRTTDISGGDIEWAKVPYCVEVPDIPEKYLVQKDDILVSRAGSVGVSYRIEEVPYDTVFASYLIRFKPLESIETKLVEYYLLSDSYWRSISECTAGIAIPNVNASKLSELEVPLPPLNEQRRIVAKLEEVLAKVDASQKRLAKIPVILKRFRQAVLAAACSGRLTADWREEHLPLTCASTTQGAPHPALRATLSQRERGWDLPSDVPSLLKAEFNAALSEVPPLLGGEGRGEGEELPEGWEYSGIEPLLSTKRRGLKTGPFGSSLKKHEHQKQGIPVFGIENIGFMEFIHGSKIHITAEKALELKEFDARPSTM